VFILIACKCNPNIYIYMMLSVVEANGSDWLVDWLVDRLIDWFLWLVGWLVGW